MLVNTTVSHISPLLYYIPRSAWYEATLQSDSNILSYPNASYHATNFTTSGSASVSFSWYGKGEAFGGYRSYLGPYKVTLDGNTTTYDGYTGGPDQYAFQLFGIMDLPVGQHHLRITNTGVDPARPTLDLDYARDTNLFLLQLIFEGETDSAVTVDHTSDKCVWSPQSAGAWVVDDTTSLASGQMGMNFTGTGIAVYGSLDAHSAPFSVSVDGASSPPLAPNTAVLSPIMNVTTLLYVKTGLLQGTHEMLVENDPVSSGTNATATRMSIASVVVFSDVDAGEQWVFLICVDF
ncbi:hypothetical protein BC628DRAFT_1328095 [Trametes gibbosa]|nr:hypothetical protein BC628DRAFT_1328095 [Trametes gibbosa]